MASASRSGSKVSSSDTTIAEASGFAVQKSASFMLKLRSTSVGGVIASICAWISGKSQP